LTQRKDEAPESLLSLQWVGDHDGYLRLLDQTELPSKICHLQCRSVEQAWLAIKKLQVRGAPAIGIAAAYAVLLARNKSLSMARQVDAFRQAVEHLGTSRPTAVNLFWALERMRRVIDRPAASCDQLAAELLAEARSIHQEDRAMCRAIGRHGAALISDGACLMTHCNAGGLATSEYGTALSVMFTCQDQGKKIEVYVDETRPLWQGARLTAWELSIRKIPATIITDSMAAHVMQTRRVDTVIVGADRITARGDTANKIGTYGLAVAAKYHQIPFYVAAPSSTFDMSLVHGADIPIEQRDGDEVTRPYGLQLAPEGIDVYNPAFDVTPAELITAMITERGVVKPVNQDNLRRHFESTENLPLA
jgi:methylthioribose-1-phosphate isomerase